MRREDGHLASFLRPLSPVDCGDLERRGDSISTPHGLHPGLHSPGALQADRSETAEIFRGRRSDAAQVAFPRPLMPTEPGRLGFDSLRFRNPNRFFQTDRLCRLRSLAKSLIY